MNQLDKKILVRTMNLLNPYRDKFIKELKDSFEKVEFKNIGFNFSEKIQLKFFSSEDALIKKDTFFSSGENIEKIKRYQFKKIFMQTLEFFFDGSFDDKIAEVWDVFLTDYFYGVIEVTKEKNKKSFHLDYFKDYEERIRLEVRKMIQSIFEEELNNYFKKNDDLNLKKGEYNENNFCR